MKNVSLVKVTLMVAATSFCSFIVTAEDKLLQEASMQLSEVKVIPVAFSALDTNKDGVLSKEEVNAGSNASLSSAFDKLDVNSDAQLSEDEFNQAVADVK